MLSLPELPEVYERYLAVSGATRAGVEDTLARKLVFLACFDEEGLATVIACSVAGAASLCVDDDGGRLRDGLRSGLCDFVVGHLDEALRILKNEVRRGLAVSVGLMGGERACTAEMMERGVQPDYFALGGEKFAGAARIFEERGARRLALTGETMAESALVEWKVSAEPARWLPRIAERAAAALEPERAETPMRKMWLARAPRILGRAFGMRQVTRMTEAEIAAFVAALAGEGAPVEVKREGEVVRAF